MERMRERLDYYRRQLNIYAYLIEQRTGQKVSKMHLYYTGEENGNPMITFPYTRSAIEGTVAAFDDTVHKILRKDFKTGCDNPKTCKNCDFRYYCQSK
jgi:DNA helicase-2/ATP-dependent DNA helicase PcrA